MLQDVTFKIKRWYIAFIEKEKRSLLEVMLYFVLYLLSLIYAFIVTVRNFLYDSKILPSFSSAKRIVSVGSLVWGGSGKTTLSIYLYHKLANYLRVCVVRRGYGKDENRLLQEEVKDVFFYPDRVDLVKRLSRYFDCFILDDGFQYRRLRRSIDIVIMNAHQLTKNATLIPAYSFRESLGSLKRADYLIINYKEELPDIVAVKDQLCSKFPSLKIYPATYRLRAFRDIDGNEVGIHLLNDKKLAALTAIGYPKGFFNKLGECKLRVVKEMAYPDHYQFSQDEFKKLEEEFINSDIRDIIITSKDRYRIPYQPSKLNFFIMEIEMAIDEEQDFLENIKEKLCIT